MPLQDESYECLEFEGDSVLGVCVATYLRKKYREKKQGFLTDARKVLVNNEQIGQLSKHLGLNRFYVISRHNEESAAIDGRNNTKKLGDIFEAFLGALWTDCGNRFNVVYTFVTSVMEAYLDIDDVIGSATNYKDAFQKYCQRALNCTPTYVMLSNDTKKGEIRVAVWDPLAKRQNKWHVAMPLLPFLSYQPRPLSTLESLDSTTPGMKNTAHTHANCRTLLGAALARANGLANLFDAAAEFCRLTFSLGASQTRHSLSGCRGIPTDCWNV
jgi:dsRNA-specific ribonuclease